MHMPTPLSLLAPFSPGSAIPAASLTQDLPQGVDADILLLGCGDVRHILYTLDAERGFPDRKIDFTACDVNENVIARNILLFTLILDGSESVSLPQLWNVYYHFYLDGPEMQLVGAQAKKLLGFSQSLQDWHSSPYGATLRFCDESTLAMAHRVWAEYADAVRAKDTEQYKSHFQARLEEARAKEENVQRSRWVTAQPCAPLSEKLAKDLFEAIAEHWQTGLSWPPPCSCGAPMAPNPLFAVPLKGPSSLKYPTGPLQSFHLAAAAAKLTELSPLRLDEQSADDAVHHKHDLFRMARLQFKNWTDAFRDAASRTTVRFIAADCLEFCYTLCHCLENGETCAHRYRREIGFDVLRLADCEYGEGADAPKQFDVVDTSTLSDRTGVLNLLVSAGPLLKDTPSATLYTQALRRMNRYGKPPTFEELVYGHTLTVSMLLGLIPAEYWTNAKTQSSTKGAVATDHDATSGQSNATGYGFQHRVAWKQSKHISGQHSQSTKLVTKASDLAVLADRIYWAMFEDDTARFESYRPGGVVVEQLPDLRHHRGSFAAFLKAICERVEVDHRDVVSYFLDRAIKTKNRYAESHIPALGLELNHQIGYPKPLELVKTVGNGSFSGGKQQQVGYRKWADVPSIIAVTLIVPLDRWKPTLQIPVDWSLSTNIPFEAHVGIGTRLESVFSDIQISFGTVTALGSHDQDDFAVVVNEDKEGWMGTSPMVVSFYTLSGIIDDLYWETDVSLHVVRTPLTDPIFPDVLDDNYTFFRAPFRDQNHVFITKKRPGQAGLHLEGAKLQVPRSAHSTANSTSGPVATLTANFDSSSGDIVAFTGHVDITSDQGKQLLAERAPIQLQQSSPFTINIVFGKKALVLPLTFPAPVSKDGSKTRIARTSCYVEVVAPLAKPVVSAVLDDFMFPTTLTKPAGVPATFNIPHLNLDNLPILALDDKSRISFLTTLTSLTFSLRERRLREEAAAETSTGLSASARLNFKESLFTIFMLASGLQGGQTGLFALTHPQKGGIHMLLFVSAIRLDGANGSVVLDAAILPFTKALVDSRELEGFLLLLRTLECCTLTLDDAELAMWKKLLPALAERCRTWAHDPETCEYRREGRAPLGLRMGEPVLCSCGLGKMPPEFIPLPEWETAARFATRVAISPVFASSFAEEVLDVVVKEEGGADAEHAGDGGAALLKRCRNCGKAEGGEGGVKLKKCMRCLEVAYCSSECQKKDWRKHRMECKEAEIYSKE